MMNSLVQFFQNPKKLLILSFIVYLLGVLAHINDLFVYDESAFLVSSNVITCHPPLYQNCIFLIENMFGNSEWVFRGFGVFCNLLVVFVLWKIGNKMKSSAGLFAASIYLLLPVIIQGSLIPDIDNTLLTLFLICFLYLFLFIENKKTRLVITFVSLLILFWVKTTTPSALILVLLVYEWLTTKKLAEVFQLFIVCVLSLVLFRLSLYSLSALTGISYYSDTFAHNGVSLLHLLQQLLSVKFYLQFAYYTNIIILWSSPFLLILAFADLRNNLKNKYLLLFILAIVFIAFPYLLIKTTAGGFPKYIYPLYTFFSLLAAFNIKQSFKVNKRLLLLGLLAFIVFYFIMGDPLKTPYVLKINLLKSVSKAMLLNLLFFYAKVYSIIAFFIFINIFIINKEQRLSGFFILFLAYCFSLNVHQGLAHYNTRYGYGERGFTSAINYLQSQGVSCNEVLGRYDVQYYLSAKSIGFANTYEIIPSEITIEQLDKKLLIPSIKYLLLNNNDLFSNPLGKEILLKLSSSNFHQERTFADFLLYKIN